MSADNLGDSNEHSKHDSPDCSCKAKAHGLSTGADQKAMCNLKGGSLMTATYRGIKYVVKPKKAEAPKDVKLTYRHSTYKHC